MALKKDKLTGFDVTASYWNIAEEHKDYREGVNRVVLYGYASAAARQKNAQPLSSAQIVIAKTDFDPNMNRQAIYEYIKTKAEDFSGSEDV